MRAAPTEYHILYSTLRLNLDLPIQVQSERIYATSGNLIRA
jgi:hypothetical protein